MNKTMNKYPFNVQIEAQNEQQAKDLLNAALTMMKVVKNHTSAKEFCTMVKKVTDNPSLIQKAMFFL
ncbi:MAG: hypothetical protein FWG79_09840 [Bacteroidales bacterium]|nr:hypothetical protein [Bacteroidales bacterium]